MQTYYTCSNNGVTAIVHQATYRAIRTWQQRKQRHGEEAAGEYPSPIFVFASAERVATGEERWLTGSMDDLKILTDNCVVLRAEFAVPDPGIANTVGQMLAILAMIGAPWELCELFPAENVGRLATELQGLVEVHSPVTA